MLFKLTNIFFPKYDPSKTVFKNYQRIFEIMWIICLIGSQDYLILNFLMISIAVLGIHTNLLEIGLILKTFILQTENAFKIHKNNPKLMIGTIIKAGATAAGKGAAPAAKTCLFCISTVCMGSQVAHHMTDGQIAPLRDGANIYFNHETKEQVYQRYHNYFKKPPLK